MVIEWKEPPATRTNWVEVTAELATRPGEWALVGTNVATSTSAHLRERYPDFQWRCAGIKGWRAAELYGRLPE